MPCRASRIGDRSAPKHWRLDESARVATGVLPPNSVCGTWQPANRWPGQRFSTGGQNWRRVGHMVADQIYERLTGEKGYFDTRVVFVDETGPKAKRIKRLAIMDQDGANVRLLTQGQELVLTPRFNPASSEIAFMSYTKDQPRVFLMNLETGQREVVGEFPGMTFAPSSRLTVSESSRACKTRAIPTSSRWICAPSRRAASPTRTHSIRASYSAGRARDRV